MAGDEELPGARLSPRTPRHRAGELEGDDLGRILALSDGVFAFAMTLLALSLTVPVITQSTGAQASGPLGAALWQDWTAFLGYAFAFVMIAVWWVAHNRTFQYIARYNSTLVWINMAILIEIAVMPFVLSVFSHYSSTMVGVDLFAGTQVALGITNTGLWDYARYAKLLKPNVPAGAVTFYSSRGYLAAAVFAGSIGLSFVSVAAAEVSWILTFVLTRYFGRYVD
jgi:uncharacterized membrane protein